MVGFFLLEGCGHADLQTQRALPSSSGGSSHAGPPGAGNAGKDGGGDGLPLERQSARYLRATIFGKFDESTLDVGIVELRWSANGQSLPGLPLTQADAARATAAAEKTPAYWAYDGDNDTDFRIHPSTLPLWLWLDLGELQPTPDGASMEIAMGEFRAPGVVQFDASADGGEWWAIGQTPYPLVWERRPQSVVTSFSFR